VRHRDEVEAPLTDWLREAYDVTDELGAKGRTAGVVQKKRPGGRDMPPGQK
jgi:hypothetical protein